MFPSCQKTEDKPQYYKLTYCIEMIKVHSTNTAMCFSFLTWFCAYEAAAELSPVSITDLMPSDLSSLMASSDPVRQESERVNTPINCPLQATYPTVTPFISFMSGTREERKGHGVIHRLNMKVAVFTAKRKVQQKLCFVCYRIKTQKILSF